MKKDVIGEANGPTDIFVTSNISGKIIIVAIALLVVIGTMIWWFRKKSKNQ